jgi:ubiquinone/menaquinone biosynthesis C-methylase UbiE
LLKRGENAKMNEYEFKQVDFEHPSLLFILEDILKGLMGSPFLYKPYFGTFGLRGDENVLDFGCGGGAGSRCLAKLLNNNGYLTCVDISNYWIKRAIERLKKYPNVKCLVGSIKNLELPEHSFDTISIFHVIHDIAPAERQDTVSLLCRKLKADGTIFVREPVKKSHGMPVSEIRILFSNEGLIETECQESKSEYRGRFEPALTSN